MLNLGKSDPLVHLQKRVENVVDVYRGEEIDRAEAIKRLEHILEDFHIDIAEEKELFSTISRHPSSGNAGGERHLFPVGETSIDGVILP